MTNITYSPNTLQDFFKVNSGIPLHPNGGQYVDNWLSMQEAKRKQSSSQAELYQLAAEKHLLDTYGVDINQNWETIPTETLQRILKDPKYSYYIDGPNEGLYVG
jgi:hypothetical protein